jgi:hypothetical protein
MRDLLRLGGRLILDIYHPGYFAAPDYMEWELYAPEDLQTLAARHGLRTALACANCDEDQPPTPDLPRMQLVFERV